MAGKPTKHGRKWVVRWWYRNVRWSLGEEFEDDAWLLSNYLTALGDALLPEDPRLTEKRYLRGDVFESKPAPRSFLEAAQQYANTKTWADARDRNFKTTLRNHYADWADFPVELLTDDHLNEKWKALGEKTWQASPKSEPKPYTRNSKINIMEVGLQVLTFAHARGMMGDKPNPAKSPYLSFNRTMTRPATRFPFRQAEFEAILDRLEETCPTAGRFAVTEHQNRDIAATMACLGVRIGEVLALAISDVDLEEMTVYVSHIKERGDGGGRRRGHKSGEHKPPRPIGVDADFCEFILPYIEGRPSDAPLFPGVMLGKFQHPDEWRSTIWTPTVKALQAEGLIRPHIDTVPHVMRYLMTAWFKKVTQGRIVSDRLGHSSEKTTNIYFHEDLDAQRDAMTAGVPKSVYGRKR